MCSRFRRLSTAAAAPALPPQYLQQLNPQLWDRATHQRNHVRVDAATGSKLVSQPRLPPPDEAAFPAGYLDAVRQPHAVVATPPPSQGVFRPPPLALWTGDSFSPPTIRFEELMCEKGGGEAAEWLLSQLYSAGLCLVTQTPPTEKGMRDLSRTVTGGYPTPPAEAVRHGHPTQSNGSDSGPYRTLYGAVWSTSVGGQPSGTSTADSAYSSVSLPLHTDMTYHATPPGAPRLLRPPALQHGESRARRLRRPPPRDAAHEACLWSRQQPGLPAFGCAPSLPLLRCARGPSAPPAGPQPQLSSPSALQAPPPISTALPPRTGCETRTQPPSPRCAMSCLATDPSTRRLAGTSRLPGQSCRSTRSTRRRSRACGTTTSTACRRGRRRACATSTAGTPRWSALWRRGTRCSRSRGGG
uniref:Uncharacterized protein n=1 Tax=Emiliania huxleyi TaxID=2903 RepID=A0A7S3WEI0_EMIHU